MSEKKGSENKRILKVRVDDDLRRMSVDIPFPFEGLLQLLRESFPDLRPPFSVEYTDDENDIITVTNDEELAEVFNVFEKMGKRANLRVKSKTVKFKRNEDERKENLVKDGRVKDQKSVSKETSKEKKKNAVRHWGVACDVTGQCPIVGPRYHLRGQNYDLCEAAFNKLSAKEKTRYVKLTVSQPFPRRFATAWKRRFNKMKVQIFPVARFVADESVSDASVLTVDTPFTKRWRLRGHWPDKCALINIGGHDLSGKPRVPVERNDHSDPGTLEEKIVSVDLRTPEIPGRYKSFWRLCDENGRRFGSRVWVDIVCVPKPEAKSEGKVPTTDKEAKIISSFVNSRAAEDNASDDVISTFTSHFNKHRKSSSKEESEPVQTYSAKFVSNETFPDASVVAIDTVFKKSWKLSGCWPEGCNLMHIGGDMLGSTESRIPVEPNTDGLEKVISVTMRAPKTSGRYISYWRLCDANGKTFGCRLWADIVAAVQDAPVIKAKSPSDDEDVAVPILDADINSDFPPPPIATVVSEAVGNVEPIAITDVEEDQAIVDVTGVEEEKCAAASTPTPSTPPTYGSWLKTGLQHLAFGRLGYKALNPSTTVRPERSTNEDAYLVPSLNEVEDRAENVGDVVPSLDEVEDNKAGNLETKKNFDTPVSAEVDEKSTDMPISDMPISSEGRENTDSSVSAGKEEKSVDVTLSVKDGDKKDSPVSTEDVSAEKEENVSLSAEDEKKQDVSTVEVCSSATNDNERSSDTNTGQSVYKYSKEKEMLLSMGFPDDRCRFALDCNNGDINKAIQILIN